MRSFPLEFGFVHEINTLAPLSCVDGATGVDGISAAMIVRMVENVLYPMAFLAFILN